MQSQRSIDTLDYLNNKPRLYSNGEISHRAVECFKKLCFEIPEPNWLDLDEYSTSLLIVNNEARADKYISKGKEPLTPPLDTRLLGFPLDEFLGLLPDNKIAVLINGVPLTNKHTLYVPYDESFENGPELLQSAFTLREEDINYYQKQSQSGRIFWSNGTTPSIKYSHVHGFEDTFEGKNFILTKAIQRGDIGATHIKLATIYGKDIFLNCLVRNTASEAIEILRKFERSGYPADFIVTKGHIIIIPRITDPNFSIHILPNTKTEWFGRPSAELIGFLLRPSFMKIDSDKTILLGQTMITPSELILDYLQKLSSQTIDQEEIERILKKV